jgi:hypothetical protein
MIELSGQRFVGVPRVSWASAKLTETPVSQTDETRRASVSLASAKRTKREGNVHNP